VRFDADVMSRSPRSSSIFPSGFVFRMAWRDSRRSRRRLVLFSFSVVLGIAALVAIGSFTANLRQAIEDQAKTLLGADMAIISREKLAPEVQRDLNSRGTESSTEVMFASMAVFPSSGGQTRLVTIRAMEGAYPFYGDVQTEPAGVFVQLRDPASDAAVVEETLMAQFGLKPGDPIKLGQSTFRIAGALKKLPGDSPAVAMLSPRVCIAQARLEATGLIGPGSLVRYRTYLKFSPGTDAAAVEREIRERYRSLRLGVDTVEERKREIGQGLKNVYAFLSLIGFISLFLGGIGVASAINVYIRQKVSTVAILRCLGASGRQSFAVYLVQGVALGLLGAIIGAALGIGVQLLIPLAVGQMLPIDVQFFIAWSAVIRGMVAGLLICVVFTLLPLLSVRRISPLLALRSAFVEEGSRRDPWRWFLYVVITASVVWFGVSQTGQWRIGVGFAGGLFVTFLVLALLARVVAWLARRFLSQRLPYVWRQGIANLHRPNNRTVLLLVSLGLGTFLLLTLGLARETLLQQIRSRGEGDRPNLIFFDIQDDQIAPLGEVMKEVGAPLKGQAPIVTMRIHQWKGRPVEEVLKDSQLSIPAWTLRREYRSTFRDSLSATEKLVAGEFVPSVPADTSPVPISMEQDLARQLHLGLGDELVWDVQGVPIVTRIASLREVEWQRLQPNFFVVFPAGVLEAAPKFYLAAAKAESPEHSATIQQRVVREFSNVSAIDLTLILETLDSIFQKIEFVVRFMALFTVATGAIVLAGAVLTGRFQRIREAVLLRTLGATRRQLVQIQIAEYAVLGALAALTGGSLAFGGNALIAKFVFEAPIVAPVHLLVYAVVGVTVLTVLVGLLANRGVATHPPLEVLRQET
jgi:putative ABC transport system permease protein